MNVANTKEGYREALTEGHKQGWSSKKLDNSKSWSLFSQRNMTKKFLSIFSLTNCVNYSELKQGSPQHRIKKSMDVAILETWPVKGTNVFALDVL